VLWARQVIYRLQPKNRQDVPRLVLSMGGSLLVLVGVLGAAAYDHGAAPITCIVLLIIVLMLVMRYRALERRSLLKCISVAAQKGIH
jgi:hypothetical protein